MQHIRLCLKAAQGSFLLFIVFFFTLVQITRPEVLVADWHAFAILAFSDFLIVPLTALLIGLVTTKDEGWEDNLIKTCLSALLVFTIGGYAGTIFSNFLLFPSVPPADQVVLRNMSSWGLGLSCVAIMSLVVLSGSFSRYNTKNPPSFFGIT